MATDTPNTEEYLKEFRKFYNEAQANPPIGCQGTCPNCGYCPHCGRSNRPEPWRPAPWYPVQPWHPTSPIWIGDTVPNQYYSSYGMDTWSNFT